MNDYDIVIIGGGPAGLSAGIYASRAGYKTLIIEKIGTGGQMMLTDVIDNYPGFPDGITGFELQDKMVKQAQKFGTEIITDDIVKIEKNDNEFIVYSPQKKYTCLSVIIASGARHKTLDVKGEKEFASRGVSYCGTCDAPFFRNKDVVVLGGGDSALTEALFIAKFAKSIKIVHRKDRFRAVQSLVKQAEENPKIRFVFNSVLDEIKGENFVKSVVIKNILTNDVKEVQSDGVFIFVGLSPNTEFVPKEILNDAKYIITDSKMATKSSGIFACGDVRADTFRQVICASSDGATAAESAGHYIDELKGCAYK